MKETIQIEEHNEDVNRRVKHTETYERIGSNDNGVNNKEQIIHSLDISDNNTESLPQIYFETEQNSKMTTYNTYWYKKLGNCFAFISNRNGDPIFIVGPQCMH